MSTDLIELIFIVIYVFDPDRVECVVRNICRRGYYECDSSNAGMLRY